ncbi:MAG TPA: hypothetical protein VE954_35470 [Oligoflexus sp.]|nr:hypothetical protein [Oligoflexus sp.]HYX38433.1 hypothetical protein [Oligoflexus sp.]
MEDCAVALSAIGFDDIQAVLFDAQGFFEVAGGETPGMPDTVDGFGFVLANKIAWCVAAVASGCQAMAGHLPGIEVVLHDVAIDASLWVIREI